MRSDQQHVVSHDEVRRRPMSPLDLPADSPEWLRETLQFLDEASTHGSDVELIARSVYLTPAQAARRLQVSRSTVSRLIKADKLPSVKVGAHHRIPENAVQGYEQALNRHRMDVMVALDEAHE